jgi:acyl-CoA synthetase (AMP-forming)/AMP-acid ligase II
MRSQSKRCIEHPPLVGEVAVRGQNVMMGYWERPEETAKAVIDGWMHTGDGGYMDEEGYVYLVDRMKDMIISGGENVYSMEVENVIAQHPAVSQCAAAHVAPGTATFRAGIVMAATPVTTQPRPIHAVADRLSPRNSTPNATPIGTRR